MVSIVSFILTLPLLGLYGNKFQNTTLFKVIII